MNPTFITPSLIQELVGKYVEVRSHHGAGAFTDHGILEAGDDHWLKLRKDEGLIFFAVANVRLVKFVD